jgi:hypothetical protein
MNERIRELWNKAAESTAAYPSGQNNSWETQVNFLDKFAELIVRECGDVAYGAYWDNPKTVRGQHIKEKIKQHFGVK